MTERERFRERNVVVTEQSVVVGSRTIALSSIGGVGVEKESVERFWPVLAVAFFGMFTFACGVGMATSSALETRMFFGVMMVVFAAVTGLFGWRAFRPVRVVVVLSATNESQFTWSCGDRAFAKRVVDAINLALASL